MDKIFNRIIVFLGGSTKEQVDILSSENDKKITAAKKKQAIETRKEVLDEIKNNLDHQRYLKSKIRKLAFSLEVDNYEMANALKSKSNDENEALNHILINRLSESMIENSLFDLVVNEMRSETNPLNNSREFNVEFYFGVEASSSFVHNVRREPVKPTYQIELGKYDKHFLNK